MTKYRTVQVELQVPEPVRSLNQRRPVTKCRISKPDAVLCSAESDLLFQKNYLAIRGIRLRGLRLRRASAPDFFLKRQLGVNMSLPIIAIAVQAPELVPLGRFV